MAGPRASTAMGADEVTAFLRDQRVVTIATNGRHGHPHVVPLWFDLVDDQVAFWTYATSQKLRNIRRDDRVTAMAERGDRYEELAGVQIAGRARLVEDRARTLEIGLQISRRYRGATATTAGDLEALVRAQAPKRVAVIVEPEHVASWDHAKLGGTG